MKNLRYLMIPALTALIAVLRAFLRCDLMPILLFPLAGNTVPNLTRSDL